ncbi:hypothetical protein EV360DRAFT_87840 [Lentinula raphanica]|nr:hypothetical protein EV360DRAFT_87840 [Lentinula raphanica]
MAMILLKTLLLSFLLPVPFSIVVTGYPTPTPNATQLERRVNAYANDFPYSIKYLKKRGAKGSFHVKSKAGIVWPSDPDDIFIQIGTYRPGFHVIRDDNSDARTNIRYPFKTALSSSASYIYPINSLGHVTRPPYGYNGERELPIDLLKTELLEEVPFTGNFDYNRNVMAHLLSKGEISEYPEGYEEWIANLCEQEWNEWMNEIGTLAQAQYRNACGASTLESQEKYRWRLHRLLYNNSRDYAQQALLNLPKDKRRLSPPSLETLLEAAREFWRLDLSAQN